MAVDISKNLKRYIAIFRKTHEQGVNEAETSLRIGKFFEDVLGYDIFEEVSKEHIIKDRCVDYAIKINGIVQFFIEVKQAGIALREKHIEQASNYAANAGMPWVLLANGRYWQMYHLTFDEGIQSDLIWSVDLLEDDPKVVASKLALLHRKSIVKGELEKYLAKVQTLSPRSILQAIFQENTLRTIRSHLKKMSGIRVDNEDVVIYIKKMISKKAWEEIGDIKVKKKRKVSRPRKKKETPTLSVVASVTAKVPVVQREPLDKEEAD